MRLTVFALFILAGRVLAGAARAQRSRAGGEMRVAARWEWRSDDGRDDGRREAGARAAALPPDVDASPPPPSPSMGSSASRVWVSGSASRRLRESSIRPRAASAARTTARTTVPGCTTASGVRTASQDSSEMWMSPSAPWRPPSGDWRETKAPWSEQRVTTPARTSPGATDEAMTISCLPATLIPSSAAASRPGCNPNPFFCVRFFARLRAGAPPHPRMACRGQSSSRLCEKN